MERDEVYYIRNENNEIVGDAYATAGEAQADIYALDIEGVIVDEENNEYELDLVETRGGKAVFVVGKVVWPGN